MGNGDIGDKLSRGLEAFDKVTPSPEARATAIYNALKVDHPEYTEWDLICFCVNYLAKMTVVYTYLTDYIKPLCTIVYKAHYLATDPQDVAINTGIKGITEGGASSHKSFDRETRPNESTESNKDSKRIIPTSGRIGTVRQSFE